MDCLKNKHMKIKRTVQKEETVETEISIPYFTKLGIHYFAILSETECLRASYATYGNNITPLASIATDYVPAALKGVEITAKEFEDVYESAADCLHNEFEKMRDTIREKKNEIYDNVIIGGEGEE